MARKFAEGLTYRQIAELLFISPGTVRTHLESIYEKLQIGNKAALARVFAEAALSNSSVAVLPFENLSHDPAHRYFSDGMAEDMITELTRFRGLSVMARNVSFQYRDRPDGARQMGRDLGVRYVVAGTVRRSGDRVRITAQLLDAGTGTQLWADRFDRTGRDVFAVQDEIVRSIASIVPGRIEEAVAERSRRRRVEDLAAYDLLLLGESHLISGGFGDENAFALFRRVIEIVDPDSCRGHARIADMYGYNIFRWGLPSDEALALARHHAERALALDNGDAMAHANAGRAYLLSGERQLAASHAMQAIALNPNDWFSVMQWAGVVNYLGDHNQAIDGLVAALRFDPHDPVARLETLFDACYMAGRYEEAIQAFRCWPNPPPHMWAEAAACYAQLGQAERASDAHRRYEATRTEGVAFDELAAAHLAMCKHQEDRDNWLEGYRKAGLPV